jgi:carboxymethylenebutenolidase
VYLSGLERKPVKELLPVLNRVLHYDDLGAPMNIHSEWIELSVGDGTVMRAFSAQPEPEAEQGPIPGLILFQEIFGVNGHIQDLAQRLAYEGFAVIAPELFHRTAPGFDTPYDSYLPGRAEAEKMTLPGLEADFRAAFEWLRASTSDRKTGCLGFCMGGRISFLANSTLPLACSVSFYGSRVDEHLERMEQLAGTHLYIWGGQDSIIPLEQRQRVITGMQQARKPYIEVEFGDADHGFFCDQRPSYDPAAAHVAWPLLLAFLREHLG